MYIKNWQFLLVFLLGILSSHQSFSKVAYIPLFEIVAGSDTDNSLLVVDLENGRTLKKIRVGQGVGPVFLNNLGDFLFAAATDEKLIVKIDTAKLEVIQTWTDLPIEPEQIVLNQSENKLYFGQRNEDSIYHIDLSTGSIDVALNVINFQNLYYSDNLSYIVFRTYDDTIDEYQLLTYDFNQLSLTSQTSTGSRPLVIDSNGLNFYSSVTAYGLQSRSLDDNSLNWEFRHGSGISGPIGELSDTMVSAYLLDEATLLVNGANGGTYSVNTEDGTGFKISDLTNPYGQNEPINNLTSLQSNRPQPYICPPIAPCPNRGHYFPMVLKIQNYNNNSEEIIYSRSDSGNLAIGRYIGDLFYTIPKVTVFNHWAYWVFTFCLLLMVSACHFRKSR